MDMFICRWQGVRKCVQYAQLYTSPCNQAQLCYWIIKTIVSRAKNRYHPQWTALCKHSWDAATSSWCSSDRYMKINEYLREFGLCLRFIAPRSHWPVQWCIIMLTIYTDIKHILSPFSACGIAGIAETFTFFQVSDRFFLTFQAFVSLLTVS